MKRRPALVALLAPSALLALIVALAATAPIEQARGAFPGRNGKVAYVRPVGGGLFKGVLHTVRPDGSHRKRIGKGSYPFFFPGGRRLLVSRPGGVFVMHAGGSHLRQIPHVPATVASLLPNGQRIAFARRRSDDIFTIRLDGSHLHRLPHSRRVNGVPVFSPTGDKIVVNEGCARGLVIMNRDGTHKRRLTHPGPYDCDFNPDFSPNGKRVVFERSLDVGHDIYLVRKTGRHEHALTRSAPKYDNRDPAFSPNGKKIVFERDQASLHSVIATRRLDGSHRRILPLPVGVAWPNWGVRP